MNSNHIFHVIKDPVHGTMQFTSAEDAWVKPFIDSPHFQRLRHIKQLGLGDFIFPGAVHTRFNHCLGCSYVGSQITQKIGLAEDERQLVMIACLLHDIGHGPFSHAFEGLFRDKYIRHEDWTPLFLSDFANAQFFNAYNHKNPRYPLTPEKFEIIAKMIMHQPNKKNVLADIVSSQLDADRLDYLLRDSHFCGVSYGEFDFRWMLHCMAIVQTDEGERLGITHKGIGTVEHYLMARRLMTRNIYHGQKKLALEVFLVEMLAKLAERIADHHAYETVAHTRLGQFLIAVNHFNQKYDQAQHDENQLRTLKARFLEQHFIEYQALCDYDVFMLIRALSAMDGCDEPIQIAKRLQSRIMPKIVRLDDYHLEQTLLAVQAFKSKHKDDFQDWQILLVETPHQSYSGDDDPIWVINETGRVKSLSDYSLMINAMANKLEHVAFLSIDQSIADDGRIIQFIQQL